MNLEKIEKIIELLKKHDVQEIKISEDDFKVEVKARDYGQPAMQPFYPSFQPSQHMSAPMAPQQQAPEAAPIAAAEAAVDSVLQTTSGKVIKSPFVGTFYRCPSPGADSFVEIGQQVKKGDVLCIVEAMKLMNEIEADFSGKIKEILVDNEQPVEFDQPLFIIE